MRYLSGVVYPDVVYWQHGGLMLTPETGRYNTLCLDGVHWAADNGCFSDKFSEKRWLRFLAKWQGKGHCYFAVAPDVPFDMQATLKRSTPFFPILRDMGYPIGLAIQNGIENVELNWDNFDAIFIAGDKAFKTGRVARGICEEAKKRKKHIHIARRNSRKALQEAQGMYANTVDGTYLRFSPDRNWEHMQKWFSALKQETQMELW